MADTPVSILPSISLSLPSWIPGQTPLSTWPGVCTAILSYLVVIFALQEIMKDRPPFKLKTLFRMHNLSLSIASLVLLTLMVEEVSRLWYTVGAYDTLCATPSWTKKLESYYMVNYYFKYIEFLDTVFLVLKKRRLSRSCSSLSFLHVFHHATTVSLTFIVLDGKNTGGWTIAGINLAVHVAMYYYYFVSAGGIELWWKKHLTTIQIIQFVIDISVIHFSLYQRVAFRYWPFLPHIGDCSIGLKSAIFGDIIITSFLILFAKFYARTYAKAIGIGKGKDGREGSKVDNDAIRKN